MVPREELFTEFEGPSGDLRSVDVEEELRAVLRRLSYAAGRLEDLPEGCTWSVVMEMKEDADAPIGVWFFFYLRRSTFYSTRAIAVLLVI